MRISQLATFTLRALITQCFMRTRCTLHAARSVGLKEKFFLELLVQVTCHFELDSSICCHLLSSSCLSAARARAKRSRADVDGGGASRAASRGPGPPTEYGRQVGPP